MRVWIVVAGLLLSASAHAQDWMDGTGPYMGVGLGILDYEERVDDVSFSDSTTAYRLFGGYQFNRHLAVEGSWGASGDLKESFSMSFPDEEPTTFDLKADVKVLTVRALGILPFDRLALFGGLGYYDADMKTTVSFVGPDFEFTGSDTTSNDGLTLIGGVKFAVGPVDIRAEYEWFDTERGVDASVLGLGLSFSF